MQQVAVIGAGIIGASWAIVFARKKIPVRLYDTSATQRARAKDAIQAMLESSVKLLPGAETIDSVMNRIHVCDSLPQAVEQADYVQEAISENLDLKARLFAELETHCPPDAILASSSSTYGVSRFASKISSRGRCLVAHPMTPPHLMPIVEVVAAPFTTTDVVARTEDLMRALGQAPVRIHKENDSFVLNRLQGALLMEMFQVISEGLVTTEDADTIIKQGLGLRWATLGPLQGIDLNAPEGIGDYLARYGHIFNDMATGRGLPEVVNDTLRTQLDTALRTQLPLSALHHRRAWRDNAISSVRHTLDALPGEELNEST